jgi:ethanolamine ammonia-lyase large subunit
MLNYQSTSFHDALAVRKLLNLRPAPEFTYWWEVKVSKHSLVAEQKNQLEYNHIIAQLDTIADQVEGTP